MTRENLDLVQPDAKTDNMDLTKSDDPSVKERSDEKEKETDWRESFKTKDSDGKEVVPKTLSRFNTKDDVVKAYMELEKGFSKRFEDFVKTANDDQKTMLRSFLGDAPDSPDKYTTAKYKEEEFDFNENQYKILKTIAHKGGMKQENFQAMCDELRIQEIQANDAMTKLLKQNWGNEFQYNITSARNMYQRLSPQLQQLVSEQWSTNNPLLTWLLGELGNQFRSTSPIEREQTKPVIESEGDLRQQIGNIMKERDYFTNTQKQSQVEELLKKIEQSRKMRVA